MRRDRYYYAQRMDEMEEGHKVMKQDLCLSNHKQII